MRTGRDPYAVLNTTHNVSSLFKANVVNKDGESEDMLVAGHIVFEATKCLAGQYSAGNGVPCKESPRQRGRATARGGQRRRVDELTRRRVDALTRPRVDASMRRRLDASIELLRLDRIFQIIVLFALMELRLYSEKSAVLSEETCTNLK